MTPKTQYQKMRDNRERRESISAATFRISAEPMSTVLEDGSVLTATAGQHSGIDPGLAKAMQSASILGQLRPGLLWSKRGDDWVHSDMDKKP